MKLPLAMTALLGSLLLFSRFAQAEEPKIDTTPLPFEAVQTFKNIRLRRPVIITHPDDGTDRLFIAEQQGVIHLIPNDPGVNETTVFLDIEDQVVYKDRQNEEGLLGFAPHPDFKDNGKIYVYYTTTEEPQTSVISEFTRSKQDPNKADPESERELMRISQPFWNHNGGTLLFGPDGYLYIALGDGGSANDPYGNGQNLSSLLGSILRIDVDHATGAKPYAIPSDNPFVDQEDARGEIWAYGFRNPWRMSFDPKTDRLWAADVGQDIWEEINIVRRGENYGWNIREGLHPFVAKFAPPEPQPESEIPSDYVKPIWDYHHDIGKSITGGHVYRGEIFPELDGAYLYADYVTGKVWALWYDFDEEHVTANRQIDTPKLPIMTFGRDAKGEIYFSEPNGRIYTLKRTTSE